MLFSRVLLCFLVALQHRVTNNKAFFFCIPSCMVFFRIVLSIFPSVFSVFFRVVVVVSFIFCSTYIASLELFFKLVGFLIEHACATIPSFNFHPYYL